MTPIPPILSLPDAFKHFLALVDLCRQLQRFVRLPYSGYLTPFPGMCRLKCDDAEKLKTWRSKGLNNLANQLCFYFWRTATLSETKTLTTILASQYRAPVYFRDICSTCYASLAHDLALKELEIVDAVWHTVSNGRCVVASNPHYSFDSMQIDVIRSRFDAVAALRFSNTPTELSQELDIAFNNLITGLRQEERWATVNNVSLRLPPKPSEENYEGGLTSGQPTPPNNRRKILSNLQPADRNAYLSYQYAEKMAEKRLEDREAYGWLKENGIDASKDDIGELADYKLPAFATWTKYLRNARKPLGEQKYTRRAGRATGRSIASEREI